MKAPSPADFGTTKHIPGVSDEIVLEISVEAARLMLLDRILCTQA
jgi:hypothetical protein